MCSQARPAQAHQYENCKGLFVERSGARLELVPLQAEALQALQRARRGLWQCPGQQVALQRQAAQRRQRIALRQPLLRQAARK